MGQIITADWAATPPNKEATQDLMVFGMDIEDLGVSGGHKDITYLIMPATAPIDYRVFNWEAAERRADWEESHGRFVEFSDVKDLLSNLHS